MTSWTTTEKESIRFCQTLSDKDEKISIIIFTLIFNDNDFSIINPTGDKNGRLNCKNIRKILK